MLQVICVYIFITLNHILVCFQSCFKKKFVQKEKWKKTISKSEGIISKYNYDISTYSLMGIVI